MSVAYVLNGNGDLDNDQSRFTYDHDACITVRDKISKLLDAYGESLAYIHTRLNEWNKTELLFKKPKWIFGSGQRTNTPSAEFGLGKRITNSNIGRAFSLCSAPVFNEISIRSDAQRPSFATGWALHDTFYLEEFPELNLRSFRRQTLEDLYTDGLPMYNLIYKLLVPGVTPIQLSTQFHYDILEIDNFMKFYENKAFINYILRGAEVDGFYHIRNYYTFY